MLPSQIWSSESNGTSVIMEILKKIVILRVPPFKTTAIDTDRSATGYDFLQVIQMVYLL